MFKEYTFLVTIGISLCALVIVGHYLRKKRLPDEMHYLVTTLSVVLFSMHTFLFDFMIVFIPLMMIRKSKFKTIFWVLYAIPYIPLPSSRILPVITITYLVVLLYLLKYDYGKLQLSR